MHPAGLATSLSSAGSAFPQVSQLLSGQVTLRECFQPQASVVQTLLHVLFCCCSVLFGRCFFLGGGGCFCLAICLFVCLFLFYVAGCPGLHYVDQSDPELKRLPVFAAPHPHGPGMYPQAWPVLHIPEQRHRSVFHP